MNSVVGIVGTGLIGASVGLRARENGARVLGTDISEDALRVARECGAIHEAASLDELRSQADVFVIAAPVSQCIAVLSQLAATRVDAGLVLDVASVKVPVVSAAAGIACFVGTHPMAGSERSGPAAARIDLFAQRPWAYVPSGSATLDEKAVAFIVSMGAIPLPVEAKAHDAAVAYTSQLPQLFAALFSAELRRRGGPAAQLCGPVANELQRLGRSEFSLWKDILESNADNISTELRAMARRLEGAAEALDKHEMHRVAGAFEAPNVKGD